MIFHEDKAILRDVKGHKRIANRKALDGLWIEYALSSSNTALHLRINSIQIDNQLDYTLFPVALHPVTSRANKTDYGKEKRKLMR